MRHIYMLIILFTLSTGFLLAGCQSTSPSSAPEIRQATPVSELSGTFTLSDPAGGKGVLTTSTGEVSVESLVVDLSAYDGQTVTFTGKFSGDTLFVSAAE